jgi:inward rectifier potassium channel
MPAVASPQSRYVPADVGRDSEADKEPGPRLDAPAGARGAHKRPKDSWLPRWLRNPSRAAVWTNTEGTMPSPFTVLLRAPWPNFWFVMAGAYLSVVFLFALLYYTDSTNLQVRDEDSMRLSDAFFFSVQTFTTIGFGAVYPQTVLADVLVTIESFVGAAFMTMGSGLLFVRVSRPRSHIAFARVAVVAGTPPVLSVRVVNTRPSVRLLDTNVRLSVLAEAKDARVADFHGKALVRLKLVRDWSASFAFPWTLRHVITDNSPLAGLTAENVKKRLVFVEAFISGTDESYLQQVFTMHVFYPKVAPPPATADSRPRGQMHARRAQPGARPRSPLARRTLSLGGASPTSST